VALHLVSGAGPSFSTCNHSSGSETVAYLADALRTYGIANRRALGAAGFDDIPRAGAQVIGRLEHGGMTIGGMGRAFGASLQAGELLDTLIACGYFERTPAADDSAPASVALSTRGLAAAAVIRAAVERVNAALLDEAGAGTVDPTRTVLGALADQGARAAMGGGPGLAAPTGGGSSIQG
jgi:hypothetical protein